MDTQNTVVNTEQWAGEPVQESAICMPATGSVPAADAPGGADGDMADAAPAAVRTYTQREFDAAVRRKIELASRDIKSRLQEDPYYVLGRAIAEENSMAEQSISQTAEGIARAAEAMPLPGAARKELAERPAVAKIGQQLFESMLAGDIPQDMRVKDYMDIYPQFLSDAARYGVKAALRTVQALQATQSRQQAALAQAARNQALPRMTRPVSNEAATGPVDYRNMSSAQFQAVKAQMQQAHLQGKRVKL